jgi:hypothetical protein
VVLPDMVIIYCRVITQCFVIGLKNGEQAVWNGFDINVVIEIPLAVFNRSVCKVIQMFKYVFVWLGVLVSKLRIYVIEFFEIWNSPINFAACRLQNILG